MVTEQAFISWDRSFIDLSCHLSEVTSCCYASPQLICSFSASTFCSRNMSGMVLEEINVIYHISRGRIALNMV